MSSIPPGALLRQRFSDAVDAPGSPRILQLLLAQDGSTTRLCESVAGGPIALHLLHQVITTDVPDVVRDALPGERFIERITCIAAHGEVMMDNLSYVALEGLAPDLLRDLEAGRMPIGHLLTRMWVRRAALPPSDSLQDRLWRTVGLADAKATRNYRIDTPDGPCMLICETYRGGMLM